MTPRVPRKAKTAKVGLERKYVKRAVLSKSQEKIVIELARRRGIKKVTRISTYNLFPTAARGIRVKGVDAIKGRKVSCKVLAVKFKKWWHPNDAPKKGDLQIKLDGKQLVINRMLQAVP